jgi:hypothetical protein
MGSPRTHQQMNWCRGEYKGGGRTQGGARWGNYGTCLTCGKRVHITKKGWLHPHGTRSKTN